MCCISSLDHLLIRSEPCCCLLQRPKRSLGLCTTGLIAAWWFLVCLLLYYLSSPKMLSLTSESCVNRGLVFRSNDMAQRLCLTCSDAKKLQNGLRNQATKEPYLFLHIRKTFLKQVLHKQFMMSWGLILGKKISSLCNAEWSVSYKAIYIQAILKRLRK